MSGANKNINRIISCGVFFSRSFVFALLSAGWVQSLRDAIVFIFAGRCSCWNDKIVVRIYDEDSRTYWMKSLVQGLKGREGTRRDRQIETRAIANWHHYSISR